MAEKRIFISNNLRELGTVQRGCKLMGISKSSYYYQAKKKNTDLDWKERIEKIHEVFPGYGYRRIEKKLRIDGYIINHKKVLRLMKKFEIESSHVRRKNQFKYIKSLMMDGHLKISFEILKLKI